MDPVRLHWDLHTPADQDTTWRVLSNTDRFNRACGLGFSFEEAPQADGTVHRTGTARKFGLKLQWEELPFEVQAPDRFVSTRLFPSGPLAKLQTTCQLTEVADGTRVAYTVDLFPRARLLAPLVRLDAAATTRPMLERTLKRVLASLEGREALDPPPPLDPAADAKLAAWAERVPIGTAVQRLIRSAPLDVQDRIRPLQLAASEQIGDDAAVLGALDGVRAGVLELRWELLCPSCNAPKAHAARLGEGPAQVHCGSCNIHYDATFPDAVAVSFRPTPAVRAFEVPVDCLLSPSRTPHVLAQATLRPDGEVELEVDLKPGGYRIDTRPALGSALLEVREGLPDQDLALHLTDDGVRPRVLRVAPGRRRIALRNRIPRARAALVTLERRWLPPHTLTAGQLLELEGARELLPADAVAPDLDVTVRRLVVLAVSRGDDKAVQTFPSLESALAAAHAAAGPQVGVAIAEGPVVLMRRGDRTTPSGSTVERALQAMSAVGSGRVALHVAHKQDPAVMNALRAVEGLSLDDPGRFCHLLLRFGEESPEVRRVREARTRRGREIPERLGNLLVLKQIARGAHGQVLQARAPDGGLAVVKLLVPELADDPEAAQRFYAEARITARLDHPHVVRLLDWGESDEGLLYMVLEHLDGEPLDARLKRGPLSSAEARTLGRQVCSALEATHAAGVLHRDLKPGNLFLVAGSGVNVKVLDYGVAHRLGEQEEGADVVLGTPEYMSPEQVDNQALDVRSDLYALGLVLYECVAGALPFEGDQGFVIAMQRLLKPPAPLAEVVPGVSPSLAAVVMRALEVEPEARFADARAMGEALRA